MQSSMSRSDLMTRDQVAEFLDVNIATVDRWRKDGKLSSVTVGRTVRFVRKSVEDVLKPAPKSLNWRYSLGNEDLKHSWYCKEKNLHITREEDEGFFKYMLSYYTTSKADRGVWAEIKTYTLEHAMEIGESLSHCDWVQGLN